MAAKCLSAIRLCVIRVTKLNADGSPAAGPNNAYVSNSPITLNVTPEIEAGEDRTLRSGCGCVVATSKGDDSLKRFTFELDLAKIEPGLLALLIGADQISSGADPIGVWWKGQLTCDSPAVNPVALEGWQTAWDGAGPAASPNRYIHWLWTYTRWQIGPLTLQDDFFQPRVTGFSLANNAYTHIWGDLPSGTTPGPLGGFFYSDSIPTAQCGPLSQPIT
ncbi:MAG: hypothetical protein QN122_12425 [Armatimonadota bacterium]|nr:hypothetical protein [Armatimonadota bacterium]